MGVLGVKMMLTLSAVTTALPFTLPPGWSPVPSQRVRAQMNEGWQSPPLANGKRAVFATAIFPWAGSLQMLSSRGEPMTVCGDPARLLVYHTGTGKGASIARQVIVAKGGYASTLLYTRPAGTSTDPNIVRMMGTFCPTGTAYLPVMQMPNGWTKNSMPFAVESLGMWVGRQPGEVMTLGRTSANVPLERLADQLRASVTSSSSKQYLKSFTQQPTTLCGHPGLIVTMNVGIPTLPMVIEQAVTQSDGVSYVLGYVRPAGGAGDDAAEASLRSLCATTASPRP